MPSRGVYLSIVPFSVVQRPPPDTWNGQIVGYLIQYRQLHLANFQEESVPFDRNAIHLQNLVVQKHYEVQVLAFNVIGQGPASTPATIYVGEAGKANTDNTLNITVKMGLIEYCSVCKRSG